MICIVEQSRSRAEEQPSFPETSLADTRVNTRSTSARRAGVSAKVLARWNSSLFRGIFPALISSRFNIATITRQLATL